MSEVLKQSIEPEIKINKNQKNSLQNLNTIIATLKTGNISDEKMDGIVKYILRIAHLESKYLEQKEDIKKDVRFFIESSLENKLYKHLGEYNVSKFDTDGQVGFDSAEEENYSKAIAESFEQIVLLGGRNKFSAIHYESNQKDGFSNGDKYIADRVNFEKYIFGEKDGKNFAEGLIQKAGTISEKKLKTMEENIFHPTSEESWGELGILLAKEFGNGVEDVLRFLGNIPSGVILIPRYTTYRMLANSDDPQTKTEAEIKLKELVAENPSLGLLELLGEKGIVLLKKLGEMIVSGKQGDIATTLITIAGLIAGGAGVVKLGLSLARKSAVKSARLSGRKARINGQTTSQVTRNILKSGAKKSGHVAEVAGKIDDVVGGAGIGHLTGAYSVNEDKIRVNIDESKKGRENSKFAELVNKETELHKNAELEGKIKNLVETFIKEKKVSEVLKNPEHFFIEFKSKTYQSIVFDTLIKEGNAFDIANNLEKFTGLDSKIYHPKLFDALINRDTRRIAKNLEKFTGLDPKIYHPRLFDALIEEGQIDSIAYNLEKFTGLDSKIYHPILFDAIIKKRDIHYIAYNLEKFTGLDPKIYHPRLFDALIEEGQIDSIADNLEKFTELDSKIYHPKLFDALVKKRETRYITNNLEKFTGLDSKIYHPILFDALVNGYEVNFIVDNLEKFTGLDSKIYHPILFDALVKKRETRCIANNFEKFTGLDSKIYHPKLFDALIRNRETRYIANNLEKFTELDTKTRSFFNKVQGRESDLITLDRYQDLKSISGFDGIFQFFIENKQKSLIPLMQKLLVAKDIGVTNFKGITDLIDTSWIKDTEPKEVKLRLEKTFDKLAELTETKQSKTELTNLLKQIKTFDDVAINQVKQKFVSIVENYFNTVYDRKIKQRFINELGLGKIDNLDKILQRQEIIEGFKMYQATTINKAQFKQVIQNSIQGNHNFVAELEKNKDWLNSVNIKDKNMKVWLERNELIFDIGGKATKVDRTKDIEHFVNVSNNKLKLLGLPEQKDAGNLVNYFNTEVKKNLEKLKKETKLPPGEFDNLYNDLMLQIQSINSLFKEGKSKEITQIKIYKETDPVKVLMMGNVVDGSCLSFYSTVGNYWSTATNALDINKGVFFIQDQNGNIIGRVLTAIDDEGKIMRFRTYIKGNIETDIGKYFNEYIKGLAGKIGLGLNGDIEKVEELNGEKWYKDPVEKII